MAQFLEQDHLPKIEREEEVSLVDVMFLAGILTRLLLEEERVSM